MGNFKKYKIIFLSIILPFFILLLCLRGVFGNFDTEEALVELMQHNNTFESSGHPFEFSRTRSLFSTTLSISNEFNFALSPVQTIFGGNDVGTIFGQYFSWAPPGTAIIGTLFYKIFSYVNLGQFGAYLSIVFVSLFIHFLIFKIVYNYMKKDIGTALLCAYLYTFGTIAFVYSITYFQHQYTILFILLILLGILKISTQENKSYEYTYLIPLIYGISVFFDYPNLIILFPFLLGYLFVSKENIKKILLKTLLCIMLPILIMMFFQYSQFNDPLQPTNTLVSSLKITENIPDLQKEKNNLANIFSIEKTIEGLHGYLFTTYRGIFFFSPFTLLGILYIKKLFKNRPRLCLGIIFTMSITILMYASFSAPLGGWCFGPRYLLPIYLFLSILTGCWIKEQNAKIRILILPLLLISLANNLSGTLTTLTIPEEQETFFYGIKNFEFILNNTSGSFIYNIFFKNIDLIFYFSFIFIILNSMLCYLIFKKYKNSL